MNLPGHSLPHFSEQACENALFHYTTANGLVGIFESGELWSTAYYCANDEQEFSAGSGVLTPLFRRRAHQLAEANDPRAIAFASRGIDIVHYADEFERQLIELTMSLLVGYISCFCKPSAKEDFHHGLLSQWRGYGPDGGYALQFDRSRLLKAIEKANAAHDLNYDLEDVYYTPDNPLRERLLSLQDRYLSEFEKYLDDLAQPLDLNRTTRRNPIFELLKGPLVPLIDYLACTKNAHFSEERECRLSHIQPVVPAPAPATRPVKRFTRNGLIVSYTTTPKDTFDILSCVDWVVVGPGPRMAARFKAVCELVKHSGHKIAVRPSHIPFTRS